MLFFRSLFNNPAASAIMLITASALALGIANSPFSSFYFNFLNTYLVGMSLLHWINDGLMAIFFLFVGLEIKKELFEGELSTWSQRILPSMAALGGMLIPAGIYLLFNLNEKGFPQGWAIPSATDIAFALGALSLLGSNTPSSLKIFLTTLAVIDDLGAILIIALFYTTSLNLPTLIGSGILLLALALVNRLKVQSLWPYTILGILLWFLVLKSGIHATLAGVALAFCIPLGICVKNNQNKDSPLCSLEHKIAPWVNFLILPLFGFANAGVTFSNISLHQLLDPITLGIIGGLFFGKQLGVFCFSFATIYFGWAKLPLNSTWVQLYGISLLCGIGFTMSLFIGLLAFPQEVDLQENVKVGVFIGSFLSSMVGLILLKQTSFQSNTLPKEACR